MEAKATRGTSARGGKGRDRGRGQRGRGFGRGGKNPNYNRKDEETKGGQHRKDNRHQRRGLAPKDAPKDSYFFKFHYGPWPELKDMEVKIDSELPEQIPKDQRLHEPLKEEYVKTMQHLDDEIHNLIEGIKKIRSKKQAVYDRGIEERDAKAAAEGVEDKKKSFQDLVEEKRALIKKKKALDENSKEAKEFVKTTKAEEKFILKSCNPKYRTVKDVNDRIKRIGEIIVTETISSKEEKEYYKEQAFLKKSIKHVEKLEKIPDTEEAREKAKALDKESKKLRTKINELDHILDTMNEERKRRKEISEDKRAELGSLDEEIKEIETKIEGVRERKDQAKEDFYKRKYEYECQKSEVSHIEWLHKRKNSKFQATCSKIY